MKKILVLSFMLMCVIINSQTIVVRDNTTREPIQNVIVRDKNNTSVLTDFSGKADASSLDKTDSLKIIHVSYFVQKVLVSGDITINLTSKLVQLDEIVFSANRKSEKKSDVPYMMEVIKTKDIEFGNQPTTGDVLANTGNIFLQKSQLGGGSPGIRGFEASRVLIVVDGVRMNNAIYRAGHLQDVMTLDAQMLDRVEVVFGPSSTMYGSDALGGVMNFYTKNAQFSSNDKMLVNANAMVRYASVNKETTEHIDFNLGWKKIASLTNITFSNFGDLMSGTLKLKGYTNTWDRNFYVQRINNRDTMIPNANNNLLVGSAYKQTDFMQRFNIKTGEHVTHNLNFQLSLAPNLPRFDRLAGDYSAGKLKFAENYYTQNRMLASYTFNHDSKTAISDNIKVILAYQKIDQERITRNFQKLNRKTQMEDVAVLSANVDIYKRVKEKHELRYGLEGTSNDVKSTANNLDIKKDSVYAADTRYANLSKMSTMAVYVSHAYEVNDNFVITDGIRFTGTSLLCNFTDTTFFKFPFKTAQQKNNAVTGSLGFTWKAENDYKVSFLTNTGFRTPNVDDMSKVFETGPVLIVANPKIKPEYAYNFELGISKIFEKRFKFDITGFYTILENAMTLGDFKYNGQDSILYSGYKLKVQAMQNSDRAYILGYNAGVQFDFNNHISLKSNINYTYGRYMVAKQDTVVPMDHIAPVFGQTSLLFKEKNTDAEFFVRYNGKKSSSDYSPSGEDNAQYSADKVKGYMPAWFTLNIRAGYNITKNFRINAACENITDNRYRVFASGINAPGRNFMISLRYKM